MINYDNNGLSWMDCETTGLTDNDKILEVAMHITDMHGNTLMGTIHTIIHHEPDFFNDLDDSVINMHTNNGLIHDCTHAGMSVQQAERKLTNYVKQANGFIDVLYPAGFSVSFDKTFINREMPAVLSNVQHRMVYLTCLNVMVSHLMPETWNHIPDFHACIGIIEHEMISLMTDDYCKSNQIGYYVIMLSMMLLCATMMAASWAYASMWKSGEIGPGRMSTKYKIILVLYLAVALFIIYAGGLIVFLIYALFAAVGAAIGWMTTKEGSYKDADGIMNDDGKSLFRVPVRLQSQASASDTIENYELKSADEHNWNNDNILNDNESIESTANTDSDVIVDNDVKSEQEDELETIPDDKQDELIDDNSKPVNDDTGSQNAESNENNEIKTVWTGSDDADSHTIIDSSENNDSNGKE